MSEHVCGLQGFGQSLDDKCPACEERSQMPERIWARPRSQFGALWTETTNKGDTQYTRTPQWIPVSERLPERDSRMVFAMDDQGLSYVMRGKLVCANTDEMTHWMPIPELGSKS